MSQILTLSHELIPLRLNDVLLTKVYGVSFVDHSSADTFLRGPLHGYFDNPMGGLKFFIQRTSMLAACVETSQTVAHKNHYEYTVRLVLDADSEQIVQQALDNLINSFEHTVMIVALQFSKMGPLQK